MVDMDNFIYAVVKGGDVSDSEILELVKQSYEMVKAKYSKKK